MADADYLVLVGIFALVVLFVTVFYLDYKISKLRRENKLLRRVLEDYFRLVDGRICASQKIARELSRVSKSPFDRYF